MWGYNDNGQLAQSYTNPQPVFVANGGAPLVATPPAAQPAWALVPNPAHGHVQLLGLPAGPLSVRLYDAQGRLVRLATTTEVELAGLTPGLYLLHATTGAATRTLRLAVE